MRRRMRCVAALLTAGLLSACAVGPQPVTVASAPPPSNWKIVQQNDSITGRSPVAMLSLNYNANLATGELRTGDLSLLCFKRQPVVRIAFNYKVGSNQTASVAYRFDENPGQEAKARFLRDYRTVVLDDPAEVRRFLDEMRAANKLFLRIDSLNVGRTNIELGVSGAPEAIDAALGGCPPPPAEPQKRA